MRLILGAILATAALPAAAQQCYGRYYEDSHMAAHPQQQMVEVFFGELRGVPILQVRPRGHDWYTWEEAECEFLTDTLLHCNPYDTPGAFTVEWQDDGTVLLRIAESGVVLTREGDGKGPVAISGTVGDDRVFKLYPGRGCLN